MIQILRVVLPSGGEEGQHWDNKHRRAYCHLQRDYFSVSKGKVCSLHCRIQSYLKRCVKLMLRYDIKMYPTFIHLHGKTFDYKIPASTVMRLFLLPHKVESKIA